LLDLDPIIVHTQTFLDIIISSTAGASKHLLVRIGKSTMAPPPDLDPNESRKTLIIIVISGLLAVSFLSVSLRLYTRTFLIKQFGWDDAAAIFAFVRDLDIFEKIE
jgi:hypothetical protein